MKLVELPRFFEKVVKQEHLPAARNDAEGGLNGAADCLGHGTILVETRGLCLPY